jgi:hypothetical protein
MSFRHHYMQMSKQCYVCVRVCVCVSEEERERERERERTLCVTIYKYDLRLNDIERESQG